MAASGPESYEDLRIDMGSLLGAIWRRKLRIVLVTALACVAAWLYLSTLTPLYEATTSLLVETRANTFTRATDEPVTVSINADSAAIESQIQLVLSRETLMQVIEAENLRDVAELNTPSVGILGRLLGLVGLGGTPQAQAVSDEKLIENLREHTVVARERDSRVISINFRAEDPVLAARVANAMAEAHVRRRADLLLQDTSEATVWLQGEIEDLRTRVSDAEAKVASYRNENDLFVGSNDASLLSQQMSDVTAQISAAAERRNTVETKARLIQGLVEAGQPVETISDVRESPVVQSLAEQKAGLQADRAQLAATLLAGHPSIRALDAQIAEMTSEIQAEGRRIAQALESQASIEANLEQSMRDELARLKVQASGAQLDGVTLAELEREATAQRDLLNAFLIRYREATARTSEDAALPDVRIVSTAAEPSRPVFPQSTLMVAMVGIIAIMLQAGGVVLGELGRGSVFVPRAGREEEPVAPRPEPALATAAAASAAPRAVAEPPAPQSGWLPEDEEEGIFALPESAELDEALAEMAIPDGASEPEPELEAEPEPEPQEEPKAPMVAASEPAPMPEAELVPEPQPEPETEPAEAVEPETEPVEMVAETAEAEAVEVSEPAETTPAEIAPEEPALDQTAPEQTELDQTAPMSADFDTTDDDALAAIGVPDDFEAPDRESREGPPDTGPIAALAALAAGGAPKPIPAVEPPNDPEASEQAVPLDADAAESEPSAEIVEAVEATTEPSDEVSEPPETLAEAPAETPGPDEAMAEPSQDAPEPVAEPNEDFDIFEVNRADHEEGVADIEASADAAMTGADTDTLFLEGDMPSIPGEAGEDPFQPAASLVTEIDRGSPPASAGASASEDEAAPRFGQSTAHIAAHISANHQRVSLIAAADDSREDRTIALNIAVALTDQSLSVALVDAGGGGEEGDGPGLTDLAVGLADFGDVVQRVEEPGIYYVPWGRQEQLTTDSARIGMLIEALGELHDHILIMCGPMGEGSSLEMFAEAGMPLVLASKAETTIEQITRMSNQARAAGFGPVSLARPGESKTEVA